MLKGIDNRLNADLLGTLRAMGHGDMLMLVDANFPAAALARAMSRMNRCPASSASSRRAAAEQRRSRPSLMLSLTLSTSARARRPR